MNEKLQYARMLEIPVNTCTVTYKPIKKRVKKQKNKVDDEKVKAELLDKINSMEDSSSSGPTPTETSEGGEILSSVTTTGNPVQGEAGSEEVKPQIETITTSIKSVTKAKPVRKKFGVIAVQLTVVGVLLATIFITNALFENSGINAFMKSVFSTGKVEEVLDFDDFAPVINANGGLTLADGVISLDGEGSMYSPCDGTVQSVAKLEDDTYELTILHSENFKSVISGLTHVYVGEGDVVKSKIPVGYFYEDTASICFMNGDVLLTDFVIDNNSVIWAV